MAYQDTSLILPEPVKNNLFLAVPEDVRPPFWRRKRWARKVLAGFDLDLELFPDAPAGSPSRTELFEVAKALVNDPKVLLLDEPTTALGPDEVEALHRTIAACRRRGVGVVYVSHRLPEVLEIADRITVLRDGRNRGTFDAKATTEAELVELIVGRPFEAASRRPRLAPTSVATCCRSTGCRGSRSARSASRSRPVRSWASPAPRGTGNRSSSTAWRAASRRRPGGWSATGKSCR